LFRWRGTVVLFVSIPSNSKLLTGCQQKSLAVKRQGFFFVDKRFEISNLDLIRDLVELVEKLEVMKWF